MKNKITERKCKDCDTIISYIPRKIRCLECHQKYIDNTMFSTKNSVLLKEYEFFKSLEEKRHEYMKQAINKIENSNVGAIIDSIFQTK